MKICFCGHIFYCAGISETVYQYSLAAKKQGVDFVVAGYVDDKAANKFNLVGPSSSSDHLGADAEEGEEYPLTFDNVKDIDLFVLFFDNGNFYDRDKYPGELDRLLRVLPRDRTIVVDTDGKYNDTVTHEDDCNHISRRDCSNWKHTFDSVSDAIFQPTLKPMNPKVRSLVFWGYAEPQNKLVNSHDLMYLGSNWYRMTKIKEFLGSFTSLRDYYPRISVWGKNWIVHDKYWPSATRPDIEFFAARNIRLKEYMADFGKFTETLSSATFSPILIRPVSTRMQLLTPRMFETFASGAIPILTRDFYYSKDLFGAHSQELMLGRDPKAKLIDMAKNAAHYWEVANSIRKELKKKHSYEQRLSELIAIASG